MVRRPARALGHSNKSSHYVEQDLLLSSSSHPGPPPPPPDARGRVPTTAGVYSGANGGVDVAHTDAAVDKRKGLCAICGRGPTQVTAFCGSVRV